MRTPIVAGNWKANKTVPEALDLVDALAKNVADVADVQIVVRCACARHLRRRGHPRGRTSASAPEHVLGEVGRVHGEVTPLMLQGVVDYVMSATLSGASCSARPTRP
ncbi:MAG: triose-phosphate isomerase [Anaerolineae bacterium]